jgi:hypothetical protein
MKASLIPVAAAFVFIVTLLSAASSNAKPPVPFYNGKVSKFDKLGTGSVVIATKDSAATVCAWYRRNLRDQNGETTTKDGAHIFYTHNGATVDVEPGNRFAPETTIGLVWDAKKFGSYTANE